VLTFKPGLLSNELGADRPTTTFSSNSKGGRFLLPSAQGQTGRGVHGLGHFDDSRQLELTIALRCAGILGIQQARCNP
jgi:hypothetical protein